MTGREIVLSSVMGTEIKQVCHAYICRVVLFTIAFHLYIRLILIAGTYIALAGRPRRRHLHLVSAVLIDIVQVFIYSRVKVSI